MFIFLCVIDGLLEMFKLKNANFKENDLISLTPVASFGFSLLLQRKYAIHAQHIV